MDKLEDNKNTIIYADDKLCKIPIKRAICNEEGCTTFAIGKIKKCKKHGGGKRCSYEGCIKSATSGSNNCIEHGGGKRCTTEGCGKSAQGRTEKCIEHGGGNRCCIEGCNRSAIGKTTKCFRHGGGKQCAIDGCSKSAKGTTNKCKSHGGGKRCSIQNCTLSAVEKSETCRKHGGGRRCSIKDCKKSAQGKTDKCKRHGGGKRCSIKDCTKSSRDDSNLCVEHGGGKRCPNCINWIDSRCGTSKYDGYCATCFKRIFPDDPRSKIIYSHTKEIRVRNEINTHFEGFIHDKPLYTSHCDCTLRRRIDHYKLIGNTLLCIETDEFAHSSYDPKDEEIRYDDIYMVHGGKMIFIRFNPDGKGVDMEDKLDALINEINTQIERIEHEKNTDLVEIIKMFY